MPTRARNLSSKPSSKLDAKHDAAVPPLDPSRLPTPSLSDTHLRMSYRIARGEQGVLTFEPYKSILLPYWRFKTVAIAHLSSQTLFAAFRHYVVAGDFVGADMARKFVQMGMTRARRYANHKGGRKYNFSEREMEELKDVQVEEGEGKIVRRELPKSQGHDGQEEKAKASEIFKVLWKKCREDEEYNRLKEEFVKEQKEWDKTNKRKETRVKKEKEEHDDGSETEDVEIKREET